MTGRENMSPMRPYWSPYLAGVALGLTLLATDLLMGFGLGASGAFAQVAARLEGAVAPGRAHANPYLVGSPRDRKSTRLNSSHGYISYAVFCLKKKKKNTQQHSERI